MNVFRMLGVTIAPFAVVACGTLGPDYEPPAKPSAVALQADPALLTRTIEPAHGWWRTLNDETLNDLVARAFFENRELKRAAANVEAARALLRLERTNLGPQAEANADYQRRRLSGAEFGQEDFSLPETEFFDIAVGAFWELDFFGRVRRGVEAAYAEAGAAEALRRDAQVLVAAETVRAYVDYRGANVQLEVATANLRVQRDTLNLTRTRLEGGLGSQLDVARAEAQAKTTEASIPPLEAGRSAAANRLATLTGTLVSQIETRLRSDDADLPAPPEALPIGDVGSLIDRRADIRAAERNLAAATARIGIAKAEYFPRITLIGAVSASAEAFSGVGDNGALGYVVGPALSWTGFNIPRVKAQVRAAGSRAEAAYAAYEDTLLTALEETQVALASYGREKVRYDALVAAAEKAREAADLARERYDGGVDDFIDVLDAEGRQLTAEAALAVSRTTVTRNYADVYHALGAGWQPNPQMPGAVF